MGKYTTTPVRVGRKIVGHVSRGVFYKAVSASIHFLRSPRAICLDVESLNDAEQAGAKLVEIIDRESGKSYRAPIARIREKGFKLNRGYGQQLALCVDEWSCDKEPAQLSLFLQP